MSSRKFSRSIPSELAKEVPWNSSRLLTPAPPTEARRHLPLLARVRPLQRGVHNVFNQDHLVPVSRIFLFTFETCQHCEYGPGAHDACQVRSRMPLFNFANGAICWIRGGKILGPCQRLGAEEVQVLRGAERQGAAGGLEPEECNPARPPRLCLALQQAWVIARK